MSGLSSRVFEAQFNGVCANDNCDGIKEGDQVFYGSQMATNPQHLPGRCRYTDPLEAKNEVCQKCWTEKAANGTCGCDE